MKPGITAVLRRRAFLGGSELILKGYTQGIVLFFIVCYAA
jgi:hypothetical protein